MVNGPTAIGSSPQIHYRPDPGEPAVRLSAPPQQTAGLVTAQEQRNETRLRSRAIISGQDILYSKRTFTLSYGDGSPVYNAGLTTVVTRSDANGFLPDNPLQSADAQGNGGNGQEDGENVDAANGVQPASNPQQALQPTEDELNQTKQDLENDDARLARNLARAQLEQGQAMQSGNPIQFEQAQRKQQEIARQLEENEKDKREVELDKMAVKMQDALDSAGADVEENGNTVAGMLDALFGLRNGSSALAGTFFSQPK
ncbi:MAG: hypothetical protein AB1656_11245 [Candidatus Omnitrophota bacterium]